MPPHWMVHLVLLPFLLSGVNGACSSDDNPIFLDPSEVIAEYEDEVTLTCNNTDDIQDAIFWQYGTTTSSFLEDTPFISWTLKLTDWNVTKAECMTRLDNALECSKELKITLFKNPDMVVLYSPMNDSNIAGTNYALQCDIVNVAPVQNLIVNWYRDNHLVKTDFFNETKSKLPVNESSSYEFITNKEDDGAEIRCEAFLDFGPEGPTTPHFWQTHIISVQYAPELMSKNFDVINVRRGDSVTVTCDVKGNPTPTFTWTRETSAMAENRRSFNVSHVTADVTYICIAGNLLGHTSRAIQLLLVKDDITEAPAVATDPSEDPDVCTPVLTPSEVLVAFGHPVSIDCSAPASADGEVSWKAPSGSLSFFNYTSVSWRIQSLHDWDLKPLCSVTLKNGRQCTASPTITLYKNPDMVVLYSPMNDSNIAGTNYALQCDVVNVAPVQNLIVNWYRDNHLVKTDFFNETKSKLSVNESSSYEFIANKEDDGAEIRCEAFLDFGPEGPTTPPVWQTHIISVQHEPEMDCPARCTGKEQTITLDMLPCRAKGNPPPDVYWYFQGKPVNASIPLTRYQSGRYRADAVNAISARTTTVDITIEYPPSISCADHYEAIPNDSRIVQSLCEPEGNPTPTPSWFRNGEKIIQPQHVTKAAAGVYVLKAVNRHGTANHTLHLDVLFPPEFEVQDTFKEVTLGENVTLDCHAEGNPAPTVVWNYTSAVNVRQATGGRQRSVTITGATSNNLGAYVCIATNKVGTTSTSVTLLTTGRNTGRRISFTFWLLSLFIVIIITFVVFIVLVTLCRHRKKQGEYSFIPDQTKHDIPLASRQN